MKFEWNDFRCILTVINVICIFFFGTSFAIIGMVVALFGIFKDIMTDRHINGFVMHGANFILYVFLFVQKIYF